MEGENKDATQIPRRRISADRAQRLSDVQRIHRERGMVVLCSGVRTILVGETANDCRRLRRPQDRMERQG